MLALGRLLLKHKPTPPSGDVEENAKLLTVEIDRVTQDYVARHREDNSAIAAEEAELDQFADHMWGIADARLGHWEVFERPAVARLAAKQTPGGPDYEGMIETARVARSIREKLLPEGLEFTRLAYPEQSEYMHTLWQIIEQDQLGEQLSVCVGAEFYDGLKDVQAHYGDMVDQQAARSSGSAINLRVNALELHRHIQNYTIALLAMIRDNDPANVEMMRKALRPIDAVREQLERIRARSRAAGSKELEELIEEEKAVDEEIGIQPAAAEAEDESEDLI